MLLLPHSYYDHTVVACYVAATAMLPPTIAYYHILHPTVDCSTAIAITTTAINHIPPAVSTTAIAIATSTVLASYDVVGTSSTRQQPQYLDAATNMKYLHLLP